MRRLAVSALVAIALVGFAGVGAVAAGSTVQEDDTNETEQLQDELTLSELRDGGTRYQDSPESVRIDTDAEQMYWMVYWPPGKFGAQRGDPQGQWEYVPSGGTVQSNAVYLRTVRTDAGTDELTVNIAYWNAEDVGPENRTVEGVTGLEVERQKVEVSPGMPMIKIPLQRSDNPREVTIWIEESEEDARWRFTHESTSTSESIAISTRGDYLWRVGYEFILPILLGSVVVGGISKRAIGKAGVGPQIGLFWWAVLGFVGLSMLLLYAFDSVSELVANAPSLLAGAVVIAVGVIILELYEGQSRDVLFLRPETIESSSPTGQEAVDANFGDIQEETVVDLPDGTPAVVRSGLRPFLARCFGEAAKLKGDEKIQTRLKLPNSEWDEIVFVAPDSPEGEPIDYDPEGWTVDLPEVEELSDAVHYLGVVAVLGAIAMILSGTAGELWALGFLAITGAVLVLSPDPGVAEVDAASAHVRQAVCTSMMLSRELSNAQTIDEARGRIIQEQARTQREIDEALEREDSTLVEEMLVGDDEKLSRELEESSTDEDDHALSEGFSDD